MSLLKQILAGAVFFVIVSFVVYPIFQPACGCGGSKAARASCQSDLKQLGLAITEYAQENDEALPSYVAQNGRGWRETLYPYVKSGGVYRCPDDKRGDSQDSPDNLPKSYCANHLGSDAHHQERGIFAAPGTRGVTLAMLAHPEENLSLADTRGTYGPEWNMVSPAFLPKTGRELYTHKPNHAFYEHPSGFVNCLFTDGHVKALKPMTTLTPVNLWTRDNRPLTGQDLSNAQAILKHAEDD